MTIQSTSLMNLAKKCFYMVAFACMVTLPNFLAAQTPTPTPPTPGPGNGINPDNAVPFDDNMTLLFLAGAVAFGVFIVRKRMHKAQPAVSNK